MVIRTFQKQRNIKKILGILIIMIVGIIVVAKITNKIYNELTKPSETQEIKIGSSVNFAGEIRSDNNFPLYTHKLVKESGETIFIKSSTINLNNYSGSLEIHGEIKDIKKGTPVVDVVSIKFPEQSLIIKNNVYFFVKDMLYLDFSNQSQLSAQKNKKEIEVFFAGNKIFSIERFLCSRVLRQKDCTYLIEDYGNNQKENFDSYRGYTYYKHGSGLWTVFDETMFGYVFKNIEEETMLTISSIIRIVDKNFILNNKLDLIKDACAKQGEKIDQIATSSIQYEDDNKISITIEGSKSEKICKVTLDMRNERNITATKISKK